VVVANAEQLLVVTSLADPPPRTGLIDRCLVAAYADHRMATAGAILGLVVPGLAVDDIGATDKTLPGFPAIWAGLLAGRPG